MVLWLGVKAILQYPLTPQTGCSEAIRGSPLWCHLFLVVPCEEKCRFFGTTVKDGCFAACFFWVDGRIIFGWKLGVVCFSPHFSFYQKKPSPHSMASLPHPVCASLLFLSMSRGWSISKHSSLKHYFPQLFLVVWSLNTWHCLWGFYISRITVWIGWAVHSPPPANPIQTKIMNSVLFLLFCIPIFSAFKVSTENNWTIRFKPNSK